MRFVQKSGVWDVTVGGRSDTPLLTMPNITKGNTLKVTVVFLTKTAGQANSGFNYTLKTSNAADAKVLSAQESIVQGNAGWQTTTKTVFFEATVHSSSGVEDVDFQIDFSAGDQDGKGQISDFLMYAEVVSLLTP